MEGGGRFFVCIEEGPSIVVAMVEGTTPRKMNHCWVSSEGNRGNRWVSSVWQPRSENSPQYSSGTKYPPSPTLIAGGMVYDQRGGFLFCGWTEKGAHRRGGYLWTHPPLDIVVPPPPPCISYALVQATVGVGTVLIWDLILIRYQT